MDYSIVSFLLRGRRRKAVLMSLESQPRTPTQIAGECKISISNVSVSLPELMDKGLVECKNPEAHTYKFYAITEKGKRSIKELVGF